MHFPFFLSQAPLLEQLPSPGQSIVVGVVMMLVDALLVGTALAVLGEVVEFGFCWFKSTCWFDWPCCEPDCWFDWPCCESDCWFD